MGQSTTTVTFEIDNSGFNALQNLGAGKFDNAGVLNIGKNAGSASISGHGIFNQKLFNNNAGGTINIENATRSGIANNSGTFTNRASIDLLANDYGIENDAAFVNEGTININPSSDGGIYNGGGTFTNKAVIHIGADVSAGNTGIENDATFINEAGVVNINRANSASIRNSGGTFTNKATIHVGAVASVGSHGL